MILTLVGNLMIQLQTSPLKQFDFVYLLLFNTGMLLIPVLNTYSSAALMDYDSISKLSISIILSIYLLGAVVSLIRLSDSNRMNYFTDSFSKTASGSRFTKAFKKIVLLLYTLLLLSGIYISYDLLGKDGAGLTEVFIPQLALFFGLFFLGIACSILRLYPGNRKSVFSISVLLVGFIVFVICLLPLSSIPDLITDAKENYESAFGAATLEEIELLDKEFFKGNDSFKQIPFSIPGYFYGLPSGDYEVKENVQFYEGMNGVDKGIKLLFDVYTPSEGKSNLPGNNAVLIRIHGGGWTIGDKGSANFAQVNKYFASRGYIVFDIQYGLFNGKKFIEMVEVPENIIGNFTIDDMVRHIGIFTSYLADHHEEYHANLSSVFISGGSAGGQLALAAVLGDDSGKYGDLLDSRLSIRGIIPFYPANGLAVKLGVGGSDDLIDPSRLVTGKSPPCLILQGTHDGIVNPQIAIFFKEASRLKGHKECALLLMPYGGHGCDLYFSNYYNQVFMYYMERFMYQYK